MITLMLFVQPNASVAFGNIQGGKENMTDS